MAAANAPELAFPPDGAEVERLNGEVMVKVQGGQGPFTWLADGVPLVVQDRARQAMLPLPGLGFVTLSVIDSEGRSARARVRVR